MKKNTYNWLPDFVYGGIDGAVTTFAVVAGVEGAAFSTSIILILGFANLIADGFSMAVGKYLSDRSEVDRQSHLRRIEEESIITKPSEEHEEVRLILRNLGFEGEDLERAHKVITGNPKTWVKMMMHHELNVIEENINPVRGAVTTFFAFQLVGIVPLLGYLLQRFMNWGENATFYGTCVATLLALFAVGTVKSRFTDRAIFLAGLETMFLGGIAATLAYLTGYLLQSLA